MSELARRLSGPRPPPRPSLRAVATEPVVADATVRLRQMVLTHHDFVWRNLRRIGTLEADADEIVQEAFLVASRRLDGIPTHCERSFLLTTAIRLAANCRRSVSREQARIECLSRIDPVGTLNPEEALVREQARARLDQVLSAMDIDLRAVFVLYEIEELTVPEIAELLELKLGTVASRLRRAREAFQAMTQSAEDAASPVERQGGEP